MSAIETPATDARAEEWGAFAVSIPGWRSPRLPCMPYLLSPSQTSSVPDPDHWAWTGWMLRMLGNLEDADHLADSLNLRRDQCSADAVIDAVVTGDPGRISRACIAAAAALGRWPGGGA